MRATLFTALLIIAGVSPVQADDLIPRDTAALRLMREVESNIAWNYFEFPDRRRASIEERMAAYKVTGVSIAVIRNWKIEWARGFGWANIEARRPVTASTLFEPGSISKALNAAGSLSLARDGRLDLTLDVDRYLRSWHLPRSMVAKGRPITLAALLSHTAGIGVRGFWGYQAGDSLPTIREILDGDGRASNEPVRSLFPPGRRFRYSGGGSMIVQQVIMDVTGQRYDEFMHRAVLAPLGMTSSSFTQPAVVSPTDDRATAYDVHGQPIPGRYPVMPEQAAAGLWTNAIDLARFLIDVQRALRGDTGTFTSAAHARLMSTPVLKGAPGLGLFVLDTAGARYMLHAAGNPGMSGEIIASTTTGDGLVVLQNGESAELLEEIVRTVARVYDWPGLSAAGPTLPPFVAIPRERLDRYAGIYRAGDMVLSIVRTGDTLWSMGPAGPSRMLFTSDATFFNPESPGEKRFVAGADGGVKSLALYVRGKRVAAASKSSIVTIPDAVMRRYAGSYIDRRYGRVRVAPRGPDLWLEGGTTRRRIYFLSRTQFFTREDVGVGMRFTTTVAGRVTGIAATVAGERVTLRRASR